MLTRTPRRPTAVRTIGTLLTAAVAVTLCGSCGSTSRDKAAEYCAIMPDAVGLYAGNPVTQLGYPIGKVARITPSTSDVRVDFTVTTPRRLPDDVKAVTRATSILADRSLELVGNYEAGPQLRPGGCIPLNRSMTPMSLSQVIGSATKFVNALNPAGSTSIGDVVRELDDATRNTGPGVNQLLTKTSAVLDSPDQALGDISSVVTNLTQLTSTVRGIRGQLKEVLLDGAQTTPDVELAVDGAPSIFNGVVPLITLVSDLERELGTEFQQLFDALSVFIRKAAAHAPFLAKTLSPMPAVINFITNIVNNRQFNIRYRPPTYRIRTPDGLLQCGFMNSAMPGSCADVNGTPYAVDVALLQYVLTQAANR